MMLNQSSELNLILTIAFVQGALDLGVLPLFYFYKDELNASPATISFINGMCQLPWCAKPLFGFISDSFPILGYRRKTYLMLVSMVEMSGFLYLALYANNVFQTGMIQVMQIACIVFRNVIGEALIVGMTKSGEKADSANTDEKEKQAQAQGQVSLFFGARSAGSLMFSYLGGAILEMVNYRTIFLMCAVFPFTVMMIAFNYRESKADTHSHQNQTFKDDMIKIGGVLWNPKIRG